MVSKRITYITFEEFQKLYRAEKDKRIKLCLLLGFGSGLRISEIIGYKRKFKRKKDKLTGKIEFTVDNSEIPPLNKEMVNIKKHQIDLIDAKNNKWRSTVVSPALEEPMLDLLPITIPRRTLQDRFSKMAIRVLNKKMSFHVLRHGFGNYQVNVLGVPLPIVQQMMGHARLDTTGIYTRANPEFAVSQSWKAMTGEK